MTTTAAAAAALAALGGVCDDVGEAGPADAVDGVRPALVARPDSTAQAGQVLAAAAGHGLAVVARGRGTKLSWGRPPARVDLILDTTRLDRVVDHAAGDLVAVTQAGVRLADLQWVLAGAGQRLAVDETVPGASVGGTVATATSGPGRLLAGTVRDLLIGVTMIRADGVVARAGGRVVKNVAGYDLGKLVTGSYGTLAVITETVFRLHPVPAARRHVAVPVTRPQDVDRAVRAVSGAQVVPGAIEIDWPAEGPGTLAVLLEGTEAGVDRRTATTLDLLRRAVPDGAPVVVAHPPFWWLRYPWSPGDAAVKLTCTPDGLPELLAGARAAPAPVALRGSAGAGVLYAAVSSPEPEIVADVVGTLRASCRRHGGTLVVLDAPSAVKRAVDVWGPVPGLALMRRVKDQFDPEHRLAPGRFVGGI